MKFNEDKFLKQLHDYINSTYDQHYVGKDGIQHMDVVMASQIEEARGYLRLNAGKYINRYGKKQGCNELDLYKSLHYIILLLYLDHNGEN